MDGIPFQGMLLDAQGAIHTHHEGTIDHYSNGLPFDVDGRLVTGFNPVVRVTQAIAYNPDNEVVLGDILDHIDQSLGHEADASLMAADVEPEPPPECCYWDDFDANWDECIWCETIVECEWDDIEALWGTCLWAIGPAGYVLEPPDDLDGTGTLPGPGGQVDLTWSAVVGNTNPDASYNIKRDGVFKGSVNAPTTVFVDTDGLVAATAYLYTISVTDTTGRTSEDSLPESVAIPGVVIWDAPDNLATGEIPPNVFQLTWDVPTTPPGTFPIVGYNVFRDGVNIYTTITNEYLTDDLPPATYAWRVRVVDEAGFFSDLSAELIDDWHGVRTVPIESHPDWELLAGGGPTVSFIDDTGFDHILGITGTTAPDTAVKYTPLSLPVSDIQVSGLVLTPPTAGQDTPILAIRLRDTDNYLAFRLPALFIQLIEVIDGVETQLLSFTPPATPYGLTFTVQGDQATLTLDGQPTSATTALDTAGFVGNVYGVYTSGNDDVIEAFRVDGQSLDVAFQDIFEGTPGQDLSAHTPILDATSNGWDGSGWEITGSGVGAENVSSPAESLIQAHTTEIKATVEIAFTDLIGTEMQFVIIARRLIVGSTSDEIRFRVFRLATGVLQLEVTSRVSGVGTVVLFANLFVPFTTDPMTFVLEETVGGMTLTAVDSGEIVNVRNTLLGSNRPTVSLGLRADGGTTFDKIVSRFTVENAGPRVDFQDNFDGVGNQDLTSHTPLFDVGGGGWETVGAFKLRSSGRAAESVTGGPNNKAVYVTATTSQIKITCTLRFTEPEGSQTEMFVVIRNDGGKDQENEVRFRVRRNSAGFLTALVHNRVNGISGSIFSEIMEDFFTTDRVIVSIEEVEGGLRFKHENGTFEVFLENSLLGVNATPTVHAGLNAGEQSKVKILNRFTIEDVS